MRLAWMLLLYALSAWAGHTVLSTSGVVVAAQHDATKAGQAVLKQGGNAVDAAIATAYALAVTHPCCGGLGGGGFALIHEAASGQDFVIDFREVAPAKFQRNMQMSSGHLQSREPLRTNLIGVPGSVRGLAMMRRRFGSLPLSKLIEPAIHLATHGYHVSHEGCRLIAYGKRQWESQPSVRAMYRPHGQWVVPGDLIRQPQLANTLRTLVREGEASFYTGSLAQKLVAFATHHNQFVTASDLSRYQAIWRQPLSCRMGKHTVVTMPLPGGGPLLCHMVSKRPTRLFHAMALVDRVKAMDHAFQLRLKDGDPAFLTEHPETTHLSVVDKQGNAVTLTTTLNHFFGSKVYVPSLGIFLNNQLDDFQLRDNQSNVFGQQLGRANRIEAGKRPLSSMTPSLVFDEKHRLVTVIGTPGGSTIPTQLFGVLAKLFWQGSSLKEAMRAPRIHAQAVGHRVYMEPWAIGLMGRYQLWRHGYRVQWGSPFGAMSWGGVAAISRVSSGWYGVMDPRRPQGAAMAG